MSHDKGPWTFDEKTKEVGCNFDTLHVCSLEYGWPESKKNLNIILAAPDMFEALKTARLALLGPEGNESAKTQALIEIGNVLKKARGEA